MTGSETVRPSRRQILADHQQNAATADKASPAKRHGRSGHAQVSSDGSSDSHTRAPSIQVGHYQLGDCLGKGAFGTVHRGLNIMTGETVAVKQIRLGNIPKSELGEIMAEIDLLRNLKHPNIVKYKGSEKTREHLFIILEYCENGSLQHICKRFGKFPEGLVGVYTSQVLDGLIYLHDQGVIHRDIKGANILTNKDGSVKLADFGVATKAGSLMSSNAVVGSPYWMAPEVIDQSGATTASDVWSVGCVVIELLEGKPPYYFLDPMPALFRIVQDDNPPLPDGASPQVKDFLLHCFQKDVNLRISARKLSRHPWIMSSRRQLQQLQAGGSMRGVTAHAEAVKSVQEWNEALKEPVKGAAQSRDSHLLAATIRRSQFAPRDFALSSEAGKTSKAANKSTDVSASSQDGIALRTSSDRRVRPALSAVLQERERRMQLSSEPDILGAAQRRGNKSSQSQVEAGHLQHEPSDMDLDDKLATIRPKPRSSSPAARQAFVAARTLEDYSDLVDDEDVGALDAKLAGMRQRNASSPKPLQIVALPKASIVHTATTIGEEQEKKRHTERPLKVVTMLEDYSETDDEQDFSDLLGAHEGKDLKLQPRLAPDASPEEDNDIEDPFGDFDEGDEPIHEDLGANIARDRHARMCVHINDLFKRLTVSTPEDELIEVCDELEIILSDQPEMKAQALAAHGALTVLQLLEAIHIRDVINRLLGLLNVIVYSDTQAQENLCLVGAIPVVMPFCCKKYPHEVRIEAAHFIFTMCSSSALTLQFVLSCRGLKTLVELIDEDYTEQKDLVWLGVACVNSVLELQSRASRNDFCRMLATDGLLEPLSTALLCVLNDIQAGSDFAASARDHILQTLLIYSSSEPWLKEQLATRRVLRKLLQACDKLDPESLTLMLKTLKGLTMNPSVLDEMENCNVIEVLVRLINERHDGAWGNEMSNQVLNAMYNLCRLNKRRQEEAAQAGLIPQLVRVAEANSPLKQFALPILCDMAHAGKSTRKLLNQQCGIEFFLRLLHDPNWQLQTLETILIWLQEDFARIESVLLRATSINSLQHVFVASKSIALENYLETFLKIFRLSSGTALALGDKEVFVERLLQHLQKDDKAIVRLNLLRILKAICDIYPDIPRFARRHNLDEILEHIAVDDGAVLVRELARDIANQLREPRQQLSLAAKDAQRTVRRAASDASGEPTTSTHAQSMRLATTENPYLNLFRGSSGTGHRLSGLRPNFNRRELHTMSRDGSASRHLLHSASEQLSFNHRSREDGAHSPLDRDERH